MRSPDSKTCLLIILAAMILFAEASAADGAFSALPDPERSGILQEKLTLACRNGDPETVERLLRAGVSANSRDKFGQPCIVLAARDFEREKRGKIIDLLLSEGADINDANSYGTTPLMAAQTHIERYRDDAYFLERGADPERVDIFGGNYQHYIDFQGYDGKPPFLDRADWPDPTEAQFIWRLLIEGNLGRIDDPDCCGRFENSATLGMALAYYGYSGILEDIRSDSAVWSETDDIGETLFFYAAQSDCDSCFLLLHDYRNGILDRGNYRGETALMRAASYGYGRVILKLRRRGANLDRTDRDGRSALFYAALNEEAFTAFLLAMFGADPGLKASDGGTALTAAARLDKTDSVTSLAFVSYSRENLKLADSIPDDFVKEFAKRVRAVDLNAADDSGRTALIYAAMNGNAKMAEVLIRAGADSSITDRSGRSAADYARDSGDEALIGLLAGK